MLFGAHVSIAGGLQEAPKNAAAAGCEVFQLFSRSPRGGPAPVITPDIQHAFRDACEACHQAEWYIHTPYYLNLASERPSVRAASVRLIREELERGTLLGARYVMTHLGSAKDVGEQQAMAMVTQGLLTAFDGYVGTTELLLEISAGSGMVIGDTFDELATILTTVNHSCGICYDTQHGFASGYDMRTAKAVEQTLDAFDDVIGLEHLKLSHCNDSLVPFKSHKDRHAHIGKGEIGEQGFAALIANPRFAHINLVLETPPDGQADDMGVLKRLRKHR